MASSSSAKRFCDYDLDSVIQHLPLEEEIDNDLPTVSELLPGMKRRAPEDDDETFEKKPRFDLGQLHVRFLDHVLGGDDPMECFLPVATLEKFPLFFKVVKYLHGKDLDRVDRKPANNTERFLSEFMQWIISVQENPAFAKLWRMKNLECAECPTLFRMELMELVRALADELGLSFVKGMKTVGLKRLKENDEWEFVRATDYPRPAVQYDIFRWFSG